MRTILMSFLSIIASTVHALDCSTVPKDLADMVAVDQTLRTRLIEELPALKPGELPPTANILAVVDRANTKRLKRILRQCGWPKASLYGPPAGEDAWLLAQHADHDRQFQREVLRLLERAVRNGEASGVQLAYLTDRVALAHGKKQQYGTQFNQTGECKFEMLPVDSIAKVEARRKALGMPTLDEYQAKMIEIYASQCKRDAN